MTYEFFVPPISGDLLSLKKGELKAYFDWFIENIPIREKFLYQEISATPRYQEWRLDHKPTSLGQLGEWFSAQVETREKTQEELEQIKTKLAFPMEIPREELTARTFSIAVDVGIYFGRVLLEMHPSLKWTQNTSAKRFADYGQPIISGFGHVMLNPVRIAVTMAYGHLNKSVGTTRLVELAEYWSGKVET